MLFYFGFPICIPYISDNLNAQIYFSLFNFAIWGEVEKVMLDLCNYLIEENKMYENLLRLAFRRYNIILTSGSKKEYIIPLTDVVLRPDYSDYFEQKSRMEISLDHLPVISIETQRKHRHKPISTVVSEILYFIEKYQIYTFRFSDDDEVGGGNQHKFGQLIDALLPIKEQYPDFTISLAPIASAGINSVIVRKMMIAGFYSIRTSYVSASENLLKKYGVMSSFANNLLLVKFASLYHLILAETDVITGIPGEADEDILQAISNLYYLRFFFQNGMFTHRMRKAEVIRCDKLYKQVKANRINWDIDAFLKRFLPADYLKLDAKNANIINLMPNQVNPLWGDFKQAESYFIQNRFEYKLYKKAEKVILYKELFNNSVINEFELDAIDWFILETANSQVISIESLLKEIREKVKKEFMEIEIINILENLKSERLIYISCDYKEILSIVNTESII